MARPASTYRKGRKDWAKKRDIGWNQLIRTTFNDATFVGQMPQKAAPSPVRTGEPTEADKELLIQMKLKRAIDLAAHHERERGKK